MARMIPPQGDDYDAAGSNAEPPANSTNEARNDQPDPINAGQTATSDSAMEALSKLESENAELKDRLLRALAETENVRRRAERDLNDMRQYAVAKFAGDMLGVADNMERAIASIPAQVRESDGPVRALIEGVELTEKELLQALEKHGVKKLSPVGERFDPNFHEALFAVPDPSVPSGTVSKVLEAGYSIGSRALRPAKVGVTRGDA